RFGEHPPPPLSRGLGPPRRVGWLERARRLVAGRLVGPAEHRPHRRPPRLGVAQLGVRDLGRMPGKATAEMRPERVRDVAVSRLLGVERLGEQDAPARLAAPVGERAVEVPDREARAAHPISWKTTRVTIAPSAPPYTTSSEEWTPDSTRVWATSRAMISVSPETTKRWWSPTRYVTATQPAHASAACPDGSPPRRGVPRPVHALVAITIRTTRTSATSVMSAGASRTRSSAFVARWPTALWKTRKPIATAVIDAISTSPAAMSFASFAFGSKEVVETSITPSIAVFSISATSTNAMARTRAI